MTHHPPARGPRPQFLRAYARWAERRRDDLPFKLRTILRRRHHMAIAMVGIHPALTLDVGRQDVSIRVDHANVFWDFIDSFEANAQHVTGGYRCSICVVHPKVRPSREVVWPSREALWDDHCFDPIADWMNGPLASARWLDLCATDDGGMTWAKLSADGPPPECLQHRLPIRT